MENVTRALIETLITGASRPHGEARALPPQAYLSEEFHELEREHIFRREWLCVGREEQIPDPGDYLSLTLVGEPIVVLRDREGGLRALSNVCRHRYMQLVEGSGNVDKLVCPYHGWTYQLDGRLAGAPHMAESRIFDRLQCRLPEFRVETWLGFVFVNLDSDAKPLTPRHESARERLLEHRLGEMQTIATYEEVWDGNWKLAFENGIEGYHVPMIHPTIDQWVPFASIDGEVNGDVGSWLTHAIDLERAVAADPEFGKLMTRGSADLPEHARTRFWGYNLYPALYIDKFPGYCVWLSFLPVSVKQTQILAGGLVERSEIERGGEPLHLQHMEWLAGLNAEDSGPTMRLQSMLTSRLAVPGPLGEKEPLLPYFHRYLAQRLGGAA